MELQSQLEESSIERDFFKCSVLYTMAYFKQIQLRPIQDEREYEIHKMNDFCHLPYSYDRRDDQFAFFQLPDHVYMRFVELLASLTLYHFSKVSKNVYIDCLDIRGLEFSDSVYYANIGLDGLDGKRCGEIRDGKFKKFSIYLNRLTVNMADDHYWLKLDFVQKNQALRLACDMNLLGWDSASYFTSLFHPGIKNCFFVLTYSSLYDNVDEQVKPSKLLEILDHCKNMEAMVVQFLSLLQSNIDETKQLIETWSMSATKLEIFVALIGPHCYQLHKNKLRKCIKQGNKWYFNDDYNFDDINFAGILLETCPSYSEVSNQFYQIYFHGNPDMTPQMVSNIANDQEKVEKLYGVSEKFPQETVAAIQATFGVEIKSQPYVRGKKLFISGPAWKVDRAVEMIHLLPWSNYGLMKAGLPTSIDQWNRFLACVGHF